jgi:hypothetical protein
MNGSACRYANPAALKAKIYGERQAAHGDLLNFEEVQQFLRGQGMQHLILGRFSNSCLLSL